MLQVWCAHRVDSLARQLATNLATTYRGADAIFTPKTIIVPNRTVGTYLEVQLAVTTGIAAHLETVFLEQMLGDRVRRSNQDCLLLEGRALQHLIETALSEERHQQLPKPVQEYLAAGGNDHEARDRRVHQLAARLARAFEDYALSRPEWVRAWESGRSVAKRDWHPTWKSTERWQGELWRQIFGEGGIVERIRKETGKQWLLLPQLLQSVDVRDLDLPPVIHVFGFFYLSPGHIQAIESLAESSHVHVYHFCPFPLEERHHQESDLMSWSGPGWLAWKSLSANGAQTVSEEDADDQSPSLLQSLQRQLVTGAGMVPASNCRADGTVQILACPGVRREAETIVQEIWSLIRKSNREDEDGNRLRFRDIAIVLASERDRDTYRASLRAAAAEAEDLPLNEIDGPPPGISRTVEALQGLLAVYRSRFERPAMLKFLTHPLIRQRYPEADVHQWLRWCDDAMIIRGADRNDPEMGYVDRDSFNWDQGLRRLVLGAFMEGGDEEPCEFQLEGSSYLPVDYSLSSQADAARFLFLCRSLIDDTTYARSQRRPMHEWADWFAAQWRFYLAPATEEEELALDQCLKALHSLRDADVSSEPVSFTLASEAVADIVNQAASGTGRFLSDGVVVSSFLPIRPIPYRVVFVCGLAEGVFPTPDREDTLDLRYAAPSTADIFPRDRDCYLLLETIVSARDRLYLSYVNRDLVTGEELPPSTVIREVKSHLQQNFLSDREASKLVHQLPTHRYQEATAHGESEVDSGTGILLPAARQEAIAAQIRKHIEEESSAVISVTAKDLAQTHEKLRDWLFFPTVNSSDDATESQPSDNLREITLPWSAIRRFLECPLQAWGRYVLGLGDDEDHQNLWIRDEPFTMPRWDAMDLLRDVFLACLNSDDDKPDLAAAYAKRVRLLTLKGSRPAGVFAEQDQQKHLAILEKWWNESVESDVREKRPFHPHHFGQAAPGEKPQKVDQPLVVKIPAANRSDRQSTQPVIVHGRTELISADRTTSLTLTWGESENRHLLRCFLDSIYLAMTGLAQHMEHQGIILAGNGTSSQRQFGMLSKEKAEAYLTGIVGDLLRNSHAYLLPCEAVFKFHESKEHSNLTDIVRSLKADPYASFSSDYGPVPNPRDCEPPDEKEARAMVARRFGPFLAGGEKV